MVLGVYPTADGYKSVRIKPHVDCYGLDWATGTIPTPRGTIAVSWDKADGELNLYVTLPNGADMDCEVILPNGERFRQNEVDCRYTCKI
jgi:hypothetical protein